MESKEEIILEVKKFFEAYKDKIGELFRRENNVVFLDFMELASFSNELSEGMVENPEETLNLIEIAVSESWNIEDVRVRFTNLSESRNIKIRDIRSKHINEIITIEGIIRQASEVRPQVVNAKFECPSCGTIISVLQIDKKFREPTRCSCGRRGGFKIGSKEMVDTQRLVIEESPESLLGGEQPKRIDIFLKEDLVEPKMEKNTTPGSRVKIIGILKEIPLPSRTGGISTRFDLAIEANNIITLEETFEELDITEEDENKIIELSKDPEIFEKLSKSMSPSVYGYEEIKKSLVLQLFGGVKRIHDDGQKSRGDIHILLVGDPGVAKSVILNFMSSISPKGRYIVGKSTSGAGLTASVVKDEFLRGWGLEAGAMVLANKGLVCIDELEKMDAQDRSSMHEAMEQQTVTVTKATVQATLRSETSVLAAANPKFGRFDPYQAIAQQIELPPTLINRFDVIFTLRDIPDKRKDELIARHIFSKRKKNKNKEVTIPTEIFRKYVAYSKQRIKPELTKEAEREIEKFYVELRNKPSYNDSQLKPIPISARQLEALIRMSEASAKIRLCKKITLEDAKNAIDIMKYYLLQVGYDYDSNTFDIDRISTGMSSSKRNKIILVKNTIINLENDFGKMVPIKEIEKTLEEKMKEEEIYEAIGKLQETGDVFKPRRGYVQAIQKGL
jgi:replicative DNA helicase Mcm